MARDRCGGIFEEEKKRNENTLELGAENCLKTNKK